MGLGDSNGLWKRQVRIWVRSGWTKGLGEEDGVGPSKDGDLKGKKAVRPGVLENNVEYQRIHNLTPSYPANENIVENQRAHPNPKTFASLLSNRTRVKEELKKTYQKGSICTGQRLEEGER